MDLLDKIREIGSFFQADAGTYVFHEGDPCQNFLILEEGCIKVFKVSEKGQELVLYRVDTDNLCTLSTSCVLSGSVYPAHGMIEKNIKGTILSKEQFDKLIIENKDFKNLVFTSLTKRFNGFVEKIDEIAFHSLKERLMDFLVKNSDSEGSLSMTHQQLANEFGVERESISRALKFYEQIGEVQIQRGIISLKS